MVTSRLLLLLLLLQVQLLQADCTGTFANHTAISHVGCLQDQASALLRLKRSFVNNKKSTTAFRSWKAGTDCCHWEGIRCGGTSGGHVTSLDLGDCGLESGHLDHVLFELTSLRYLNLGGNDFNYSEIPSNGFEQLTKLTHLNLSTSYLSGQVPAHSIGRLTDLVSLDLSYPSEIDDLFDDGYRFPDIPRDFTYKLPNLTALVANLTRLRELHLGWVDMSSQVGKDWCNGLAKYNPNLLVLSLPFCFLPGTICGSLAGLQSLSVLDLQYNRLTGPIPVHFANFSSLRVLQLRYNYLYGRVSPEILQNKELVTIDLQQNPNISGNLPSFTTCRNQLENLFLGGTSFCGTIPTSISNLESLKNLGLDAKGFAGELPLSIGKLRSLNSLQISGFEVVGPIPSWITNLTYLEVLEFSNCGLHGPIPSSIGDLNKLRELVLYNCNFSGKIPPHILNLTQLDTLQLNSNSFVGTMQLNSLWKLPNLFDLKLSNNKLNVIEKKYNSSLPSFPNIEYLGLASCNITHFPNILRHSNHITAVDISDNQIHGAIPQWVWEILTDLDFFSLNLSHNKFTSVGYGTFLPFSVVVLDLSFNMFEGPIPIPQYSQVLDYSSNSFTSIPLKISTQLEDTYYFKASTNHLSGNIPTSFCSTTLRILDLSYNNLSGSVPSCLMEDANALQVLNLNENQLSGELPHNINESCVFEALQLSGNRIEGQLPRSLASCKFLEVLDIGNNQISDSFPCWMTALPRLQVLVLKSNKFFGEVSSYIADEKNTCEFPSLRILDLASNNLSGTLTEEWFIKLKSMMVKAENEASVMEYRNGNQYHQVYQVNTMLTYKGMDMTFSKILLALVFIDVSNNAIHGSIPGAIGELGLLRILNMSHNFFMGQIPSQFGRLNQLESLDLSSNAISGEIPNDLSSLDFLTTLNLSNNMLTGRIPESRHFSSFINSSFMGNSGLCGPPLSKQCGNETTPNSVLYSSKKSDRCYAIPFCWAGIWRWICYCNCSYMGSPHQKETMNVHSGYENICKWVVIYLYIVQALLWLCTRQPGAEPGPSQPGPWPRVWRQLAGLTVALCTLFDTVALKVARVVRQGWLR